MNDNLEKIELNYDFQENKKTLKGDISWIKNKNHQILKKLEEKGGAIYMNLKGGISYRLSPDDSYTTTKDYMGLSNIFTNFLGIDVDFSTFSKKIKIKDNFDEEFSVKPEDLVIVSGIIFETHNKEEFIKQENGTYLRNTFRLSKYLEMKGDEIDFVKSKFEKSITFLFLLHLLNHNYQKVQWVINWLAYFFQELKKSQVALVLLGVQGAGKGIFFNEVIKPLFGEEFVKTINDKSLDTRFLGSLVENTMFFNLDEISANKSQKNSIKNFLKALVTNGTITAEKKYKNMDKEIPIFGQVLITSNELYALEIEPSDRRFTVFNTGGNLAHCNFLGFGSYESLSNAIKNDLEQFAVYLKSIQIDVQMANTALNTTEKDNLIQQYQMKQYKEILKLQPKQPKLTKLEKNIFEFSAAIKYKNFNLFRNIVDEMLGRKEFSHRVHSHLAS
ncbi:primase-helicase family protein [Aliarcobacter butzleri]|uniref:primase-helicase family protein n=1 Tax=Aliarcobacter butzleri TaxID=28197 RepID=UPI00125F69BE|nr:primase-helicase family protein [Aliarcobacter butzleri]